jgi:hypothetical protein
MQKAESIFNRGFMRHVFHGTHGGGFHHEGAGMRAQFGVCVIEETRGHLSGKGIYKADVLIRRCRKKESSHFFPRSWTRVQVLEAIKEAYATRRRRRAGELWACGWSESYRMKVMMCLDDEGRICTAFPLRGTLNSQLRVEKRRAYRTYKTALRWWVFVIVLNWMKSSNLEAAFVQIGRE